MKTEVLSQFFMERYSAWLASQQGQTSGYEYEKSFVEMMQEFTQIAFQTSLGDIPKSRNEKKTSAQAWGK